MIVLLECLCSASRMRQECRPSCQEDGDVSCGLAVFIRAIQDSLLMPMRYRPNCILMDEIDGVDNKATINALLQIIERGNGPAADSGKGTSCNEPSMKHIHITNFPYLL